MNDSPVAKDSKYHLLVVDDDQEQAGLISDYLGLSGPFDVELAFDTHSLWERVAARPYDAILLDYHLGDGNGLDILNELPRRGYQIPVVMVTGQGDERVATQAIQRGAVDYLVKDGSCDFLKKLPALVHKTIQYRQLKLAVEQSLEKIRYQAFLLNNVQDAIVVWDLEGKITFWNFAAQSLFGWSAEERIGEKVETCYFPIFDPPIGLPTVEPRQSTFQAQEVERQCVNNQNENIWINSCTTALYDKNKPEGYPHSGVTGYMNISRDITRRKHMEKQMQAAQAKLAQTARLAAIGELASGVAHQISNPLTTIIADAQILLNTLPDVHPGRESAKAIEKAGWRTQQVVQRLMEFARPTADTLETLCLNQTIENALMLVGAAISSAGVSLDVDLSQPSPDIIGNARQLEDLWVNLLLLARDATADGEKHTISIHTWSGKAGMVMVEIHDDGKTIPPHQVEKIFEPNFVGPVGGRGTGMELSICQEIVRQHRGHIEAHSESGKGTTFRVQFPVEQIVLRG